jgi:hypothetical protein
MLVIEFGSLDAKMFKYFTHKHEAEAPPWLDFRHFAYVLLYCFSRAIYAPCYMRCQRLFSLKERRNRLCLTKTGLIKSLAIECIAAG